METPFQSDERLLDGFVGLTGIVANPALRNLLDRVAVSQRESAAILRAHGERSEADRAERFASRIRLTLDEPKAVQRMHALTESVRGCSHHELLLERALDGAISLVGGDFGNIQIRDPSTGTLRIVAESGFSREFLEYFAAVDDPSSACGRAAIEQSQTVIADVDDDPAFAPHRGIASASGFRAVQSTPLVDPSGRLRGVISTHYRRRHCPSARELQIIGWFGEELGAALAAQQGAPTALYEAKAAAHEQTATSAVRPARSKRRSRAP